MWLLLQYYLELRKLKDFSDHWMLNRLHILLRLHICLRQGLLHWVGSLILLIGLRHATLWLEVLHLVLKVWLVARYILILLLD